jgi:addiction module RelE/StbE family toxin
MEIHFHRNFEKRFAKLPEKIQKKATEKILLFKIAPFHETLRNHALMGKYIGFRSINITGDFRAIYNPLSDNEILFIDIGAHSRLYK